MMQAMARIITADHTLTAALQSQLHAAAITSQAHNTLPTNADDSGIEEVWLVDYALWQPDTMPRIPLVLLLPSAAALDHLPDDAPVYILADALPTPTGLKRIIARAQRAFVDQIALDTCFSQLNQSSYQFLSLINQNTDGMLVVAHSGRVLFANPAAEHIFHRQNLVGQPFGVPVVTGSRTEIIVPDAANMTVLEMRVAAITWDGLPAHLATLRDVTRFKETERTLRQTLYLNTQLSAAVEKLSAGVLITDPHQPDNPITYANQAFSAITGYQPQDVIGSNCRFLQGPDTDPQVVAAMRQAIAERRVFRDVVLNYRRDGTPFWNDLTIGPVYDDNGELINFVGLQIDITERVQAQEQVRLQANVMDRSHEAILISDPQGMLTYCNDAAVSMLSLPAQAIIGSTLSALYDRLHAAANPWSQIKRGLENNGYWRGEASFIHPGGETRITDSSMAVIHDDGGRVTNYSLIISDVTADRRREQTVKEQTEILETVFDNIPVMLAFMDPDGRVKLVNRRWEQVIGWTLAEMRGSSDYLTQLYPGPNNRRRVLRFLQAGGGVWQDFQTVVRSGHLLDIAMASVRLSDGTIVSLGQDVTERNQMAYSLRKQREMAEALRDTAVLLTSKLDLEAVLNTICIHVGRVVPNDVADIMLLRDAGRVEVVRSWSQRYPELALSVNRRTLNLAQYPTLSRVLRERKPVVIHDTRLHPDALPPSDISWVRSVIHAPIRIEKEVIGFLNVSSTQADYYTLKAAQDLQTFADQAAIAIQNANLYTAIKQVQERTRHLSQQVITAQEEERRRISRELHDETGQGLTALRMTLEVLKSDMPLHQAPVQDAFTQVIAQVSEITERLRQISHQLRPPTLDTISLSDAMQGLCIAMTQQSGVRIHFQGVQLPEASEAATIALYRVLQEALTNVVKHAHAHTVTARLASDAEAITLTIQDDGQGFEASTLQAPDAQGRGIGLLGMAERMEILGGSLHIDTAPGRGVTLIATLPWKDDEP